MQWFHDTHEIRVIGKRVMYARVALPGPGGVGDQDARLMQAIDIIRDVSTELINTKAQEQTEGITQFG